MLDWTACPAAERDPRRVSGTWVFRGTRVPIKALFENLEGGARVAEFLEWFPGVTQEQVEAVLEHAARSSSGPEAACAQLEYLDARAARGSREEYDRVLAKVPAVAPVPGDERP